MCQCVENTVFGPSVMFAVPLWILICMSEPSVDCSDEGVLGPGKPGCPGMEMIHLGLVPP